MNVFSILHDPTVYQLLISAGLGALIGLERELAGKDPSLRTFMLISMGSCLFSMISGIAAYGVPNADPGRISAQIVTGIGFLGAGAIFRSRAGVSGLTTAALMWLTAGVGMSVGLGKTHLGVTAAVIALLVMVALKIVHKTIRRFRPGFYKNQEDYY